MKKNFDCVRMKQKAQDRINRESRSLSRKEELEYFHQGAEKFWSEIRALRASERRTARRGTGGATPASASPLES